MDTNSEEYRQLCKERAELYGKLGGLAHTKRHNAKYKHANLDSQVAEVQARLDAIHAQIFTYGNVPVEVEEWTTEDILRREG